jgi:hypothetical protein
MRFPPCLHCGTKSDLVTGRDIYPHRRDLWHRSIWRCPECGAYVGCHPDTENALGYPANAETRKARKLLHEERLDPLWRRMRGRPAPRLKRDEVYEYLARRLGLEKDKTHTGLFDIETCRDAWRALSDLARALDRGEPKESIFERIDPLIQQHRDAVADDFNVIE